MPDEERKEILARTPKPERFTPEKAKEVQENNLRGVVKAGNGSIIEVNKDNFNKCIGKEITQTDNQHIREWYYANVSDIPSQIQVKTICRTSKTGF